MEKTNSAFTFSTVSAGVLASVIGYSSTAILIFQAAIKIGLSPEVASSWLTVLCISMGLLTTFFSLKNKVPIMFVWSTSGIALLLNSLDHQNINNVYGAFVFSAIMICIVGFSGFFEKMISKIPLSLAQAMLSGILLNFALNVFRAITTQAILTVTLFLLYLIFKKFIARYAIIILAVLGLIISLILNIIHFTPINFQIALPVYYAPHFDFGTIISIGLPLFIVTMTSQNMAGVATLHAHNYQVNISKLIGCTGLINILIAPFGGYALNLAAITASICMGKEAHPDKDKRYMAAVISGIFYIFVGIFAGIIGQFFSSLPKELVAIITGLALFGTITNGLEGAFKKHNEIDSAMITFFITASGITFLGIGSAFWGIVGGGLNYLINHYKKNNPN